MKFPKLRLPNETLQTAQTIAQQIGTMSVSLAGVSGHVEDTSNTLTKQAATLETISSLIAEIASQSHSTIAKSDESRDIASKAEITARESTQKFGQILHKANLLTTDVLEIGNRLASVQQKLAAVQKISNEIDTIAQRASLLWLNAAVEAARAGESGLGFRVVASEFKSLSEFTATSTIEINNSLEDLTHEIAALVKNATLSVSVANELGTDAQGIEEQIHNVPEILSIVTQNQNAISLENKEISVAVETISQEVAVLSGGISESVELIKEAAFSLDDLRRISEQMTGTSVKLGVATDDTLFINHVKKIARAIGSAFEDGVKKGYLDRQDLFDQTYREIHGTNPVQYETRYTSFVDKVLPEIQEPVLELSDRVVFCAAVDVNGYLPTHNLKFSHPQRPDDPDWNAANARNRRIFDDRVGLAAGQNTDDFLLQAYRRDMGNGQFALMKDLSAPIYVHGQHWGGVRLAYRV